jgi:hypothetical protein
MENACRLLVRKPVEKQSLERPRQRWKNHSIMDLSEVVVMLEERWN